MIKGLYAITPDGQDTKRLVKQITHLLEHGVNVIQYRNKMASPKQQYEQAWQLRKLTKRFNVPLIINDNLDLAIDVLADGLHLGRQDIAITVARRQLRSTQWLGVSCYNNLDYAQQAITAGANYLAFGAVFPSITKPQAVRAPLSLLSEAKQSFQVPIVAIGGINPDNISKVLAAGADAVAVISALFAADDIAVAAALFNDSIQRYKKPKLKESASH